MSHKQKNLEIHEEPFFPIVGIGASAGGLDAFRKFLEAIPEKSGMTYVLIQHMKAEHESALINILSKYTKLPVTEVTDKIHIEQDNVYVIPPGKLLVVSDGMLKLSDRSAYNKNIKPIDLFFSSLATVYQNFAVGIVLSGSATDGTLGLKIIKANGGITFSQDEATAAFESMPRSAISAGVVDFILPPELMPAKLMEINQPFHLDKTAAGVEESEIKKEEEIFKQIITILRLRKNVDFTYYKQTTIKRRIIRRMALNKIARLSDYLNFLRENKIEPDLLYDDMLISVTNFFRDEKYFEILCGQALPLLLKQKATQDAVRIWIVGCASGEEAYSMAICLHESLLKHAPGTKLQIFATDISEKAIAKARKGEYTLNDLEDVSAERLQHFFTKLNGSYQINKSIREMCVFAHHNILKDPPFAKMEIISCRNVLIYMEPVLQKKVLSTFHYSLKENGFLMLGKSESISCAADLFTNFIDHDKIFTKRGSRGKFMAVATERSEENFKNIDKKNMQVEPVSTSYQKIADQVLLSRYTPAGVVVNEQFDIVQFRGATGAYLEPSPGKASFNLMKMAKDGLAFELRNILHKAKSATEAIKKEGILIDIKEKMQMVTIEAMLLPNTIEPYYLVLFTHQPVDKKNVAKRKNSDKINDDTKDLHIKQLEKEIEQMREDMRSITEEQEAANEELQSSNEELLSSAEELQSLNEELETAQEELQSANEELNITNHELVDRNEQLNNARTYAESIIQTVHEPLVILDKDFTVRTATDNFYKTFGISPKETENKLLFNLEFGQWNIPELKELLAKVLTEAKTFTGFEITHNFAKIGVRTLSLNARPIDKLELILLAIEDISDKANEKNDLLSDKQLLVEKTQQLSDAIKKLEESNQSLEQFAFIASHDLQEPLRKIKTFLTLLQDPKKQIPEGGEKQYYDRITDAARRMQILINDLLAFSRLSNGQNFIDVDLNKVLANVIKDLDVLIQQKKVVINIAHLPVIKAIPVQMNQLFINLLSNAIKFSKEDITPVINIGIETLSNKEKNNYPELEKEKTYCKLSFADNGIGFKQEYAERVFEIFQRLVGRSEYPGTGIGLAICRKILANHKGAILAESKENEGTTFYVILAYDKD